MTDKVDSGLSCLTECHRLESLTLQKKPRTVHFGHSVRLQFEMARSQEGKEFFSWCFVMAKSFLEV